MISPRSQDPAWERKASKLCLSGMTLEAELRYVRSQTGVWERDRTCVPKLEFGNEIELRKSMPTWDKDLYYRFRAQRTQPSIDLVSRISIEAPQRVIDLGCGPGNSTAVLRGRWPKATIIGVDNSAEMLRAATESDTTVQWVEGDIASWRPEQTADVIFSNAALQWVDRHESLIPSLHQSVAPGGVLAVQMPDHYDSPLYRVLLDVAGDPRWSAKMDAARGSLTRHSISFYYDLLSPLGDEFDLWTTEYQHVLASHQEILNFHRGTGMRPFLASLDLDEVDAFEERVLEGYRDAFAVQADGAVLFPFKRLFFTVKREP